MTQSLTTTCCIAGGGPAGKVSAPFPLRLLQWFPYLRRIPARVIGLGFRPEHVRTPDDKGTLKSLG
jgi:hypothetical protein